MLTLVPQISYAYKMISSFYDNYLGEHVYDEIKKITLNIKKVETEREKQIHGFYQLYLLIFSRHYCSTFEEYLDDYLKIYKQLQTEESFAIKNLLDLASQDLYLAICRMNVLICKGINSFTFFCYLLLVRLLNNELNQLVVMPENFTRDCSPIHDEVILKYFVMGWISSLKKDTKEDLKNSIIKKYQKEKMKMIKKGIKALYLFGSIMKGEYHKESDIDLVVKFDNKIDYFAQKDLILFLKKYNLKNFMKESDILEYDDFMEYHKEKKVLQLF